MDTPIFQIIVAVVAALVVLAAFLLLRRARPKESPTVQLVKRRRELTAELREFTDTELQATQLLRAEAQRRGVAMSSVDALEAAVETARRRADVPSVNPSANAASMKHRAGEKRAG
jgi:hypothetical protein